MIDGLRVAYEDAGTGLPIVFIPGLTGTKDWFTYQFRGLRESYRIISYDVRAARSAASYTLDLLAEDLARLLATLRLPSAVIAGHSYGAMIAQKFAACHPEQVAALILISAFAHLPETPSDAIVKWMSPGTPPVEPKFKLLLRKVLHLKPPAPPDDIEGLEWLAWHGTGNMGTTLSSRVGLVQEFDSARSLSRMDAPSLVIVGADDDPVFLSAAQELYETIPDTTLEVIEGGDHYCFFTRHDIVNSVIDEFLMERQQNL
jgi:pimeloyl-ACP methyl ester carboxylesterase